MKTELTFHGAAGCVTGFCARLKTERATVLVDCGLFQGPKTLKALNYQRFPFDAGAVDAVLLTHAHIDHSGQLPKLMRAGFAGPIYATPGTRALCEIMLADCGHIQESEVEHLNRRNEHRGRPLVEPIYTVRDAERVMRQFAAVDYEHWTEVAQGVRRAGGMPGHILGSASIEVEVEEEGGPLRLMFSGDLGPGGRDYLRDPVGPAGGVDHLVVESTYGGAERPPCSPDERRAALAKEMREGARGRRAAAHPRLRRRANAGAAGRPDPDRRRRRSARGRDLPGLAAGDQSLRGLPRTRVERGARTPSTGSAPRAICTIWSSPARATSSTRCAAGTSSWPAAACATPAGCAST